MNYIRTSSGGMMAITHKTSTVVAVKKTSTVVKPARKSKKDSASLLK